MREKYPTFMHIEKKYQYFDDYFFLLHFRNIPPLFQRFYQKVIMQ